MAKLKKKKKKEKEGEKKNPSDNGRVEEGQEINGFRPGTLQDPQRLARWEYLAGLGVIYKGFFLSSLPGLCDFPLEQWPLSEITVQCHR